MNEKIYKTMASSGAGSLALGIVVLVTGLVTGILMIVNGARLLRRKSEILIEYDLKSRTLFRVAFRTI